jgi:hypothetical protein
MKYLGFCFGLLAASAWAQAPAWSRPYVADLRLRLELPQRAPGKLLPGDKLELEAGSQAILRLEPLDQWGRAFPPDWAGFFLDQEEDCQELFQFSWESPTRLRLVAGTQRGSCQLQLVLLGNLNLSWPLRLAVTSMAAGGYTRPQAEYIVIRLYRALFNREPDPQGFQAAVLEVQRNRLGSLLEGMLKSQEFKEKAAQLSPPAFLEQVYRGLLGRPPDSQGVSRYLREVERGKLKGVLADIIHSQEFEAAMAAATSNR